MAVDLNQKPQRPLVEHPRPQFSIITVIHNIIESGRWDMFLQAVDSVRAQTCRNLEHIVVDGASDDGTVALIAKLFSEGRIHRYVSEPDSGIYHAMNRGARESRGDYLLFLNSDDYYHDPRGLEEMSARLDSTQADFACSRMMVMQGGRTAVWPERIGYRKLLLQLTFGHQGMAVKRDLFHRLGGFDTGFRIAGDYEFILRMFLSGARGIAIREPFVTYRRGGASSDKRVAEQELMRVRTRVFDRYGRVDWTRSKRYFDLGLVPYAISWNLLIHRDTPLPIRKIAFASLLLTWVKSTTHRWTIPSRPPGGRKNALL